MNSPTSTPAQGRVRSAPRLATQRDVPRIASTMAAAFFDDPVLSWIYHRPPQRRELLPRWFEMVAEIYVAQGEVHTNDDVTAAAIWVPAGTEGDERLADDLVAISGPYGAALTCAFEVMSEHHPHGEHHYLFLLGTRPGLQGRGIGSKLMRTMLERCDRDGIPAYLEATSEVNKRLYVRHHFEVTGRLDLPGGPSMWPMWRQPRPLE